MARKRSETTSVSDLSALSPLKAAGGCLNSSLLEDRPLHSGMHRVSGYAPLAFLSELTHMEAGQGLIDARACSICGLAHPLWGTAAPGSPAMSAWGHGHPVSESWRWRGCVLTWEDGWPVAASRKREVCKHAGNRHATSP